MKNLLIAILFCIPTFANASETCQTDMSEETVEDQLVISKDVPKFLEGAIITVRTKDGRESTVPAERFKVVPRNQQFIVSKTKQRTQTVCSPNKEKNRLSLVAGKGPQEGLDTTRSASEVTVESKTGFIGGVQYQRQTDIEVFGLPLSVGGQLQSNESALGVIGLDF